MPIGADVSAQYTEEAVGGGHPTKARVIDRLGLVEHHVDGRHRADLLPIGCGAYFEYASATQVRLLKAVAAGLGAGHSFYGDAVPFLDGSGNLYYLRPNGIITKDSSGLLANTVYYVYAYDNAGAVVLELSTTTWSSAELIPTKSGDMTRTLVGMLRTNGSSQFVNTTQEPLVKSFWNQVPRYGVHDAAGPSHANSTWTQVCIVYVLSFGAGEPFHAWVHGRNRASGTGTVSGHAIDVDSTNIGGTVAMNPQSEDGEGGNIHTPIAISDVRTNLGAGYHTIQYVSRVVSGAGTIDYGNPSLFVLFWG